MGGIIATLQLPMFELKVGFAPGNRALQLMDFKSMILWGDSFLCIVIISNSSKSAVKTRF